MDADGHIKFNESDSMVAGGHTKFNKSDQWPQMIIPNLIKVIVLQICRFPVIHQQKMKLFPRMITAVFNENLHWAYEYI